MVKGIESNFASNDKYVLRFAQNSEDTKAAQHLRFNVFNLELGEGLCSSVDQQLDVDRYDAQCHHLLVIFKDTGHVVGTYRMQTHDIAKNNDGFYTAKEYNLNTIPQKILNASVEVGRACIEAEHRNGRVLYLLWRGLAKYLQYYNKKYLFGCCSLTSQSSKEAWSVMKFLENHHHIHDQLMVSTKDKYNCERVKADDKMVRSSKLPQLFRLYMDLGAKVCSPPAIDKDFKTIDFLVLLDINKLDERTRMLFFS